MPSHRHPTSLHPVIPRPSLALAGAWLVGLREWLALARARRHQARAPK